jgi:hypothetical protein
VTDICPSGGYLQIWGLDTWGVGEGTDHNTEISTRIVSQCFNILRKNQKPQLNYLSLRLVQIIMDKWEIMETHPYYNLKGNKPLVTKGPSLGGRRHKIRLPTCTHRDPLGKGACQRMKTNKEQLSPNPLEFNTLGLQEFL